MDQGQVSISRVCHKLSYVRIWSWNFVITVRILESEAARSLQVPELLSGYHTLGIAARETLGLL